MAEVNSVHSSTITASEEGQHWHISLNPKAAVLVSSGGNCTYHQHANMSTWKYAKTDFHQPLQPERQQVIHEISILVNAEKINSLGFGLAFVRSDLSTQNNSSTHVSINPQLFRRTLMLCFMNTSFAQAPFLPTFLTSFDCYQNEHATSYELIAYSRKEVG